MNAWNDQSLSELQQLQIEANRLGRRLKVGLMTRSSGGGWIYNADRFDSVEHAYTYGRDKAHHWHEVQKYRVEMAEPAPESVGHSPLYPGW